MSTQRKLASYPMYFEHLTFELPKPEKVKKRQPGRKPKYPRLPQVNVLDNPER